MQNATQYNMEKRSAFAIAYPLLDPERLCPS